MFMAGDNNFESESEGSDDVLHAASISPMQEYPNNLRIAGKFYQMLTTHNIIFSKNLQPTQNSVSCVQQVTSHILRP